MPRDRSTERAAGDGAKAAPNGLAWFFFAAEGAYGGGRLGVGMKHIREILNIIKRKKDAATGVSKILLLGRAKLAVRSRRGRIAREVVWTGWGRETDMAFSWRRIESQHG